MDTQEELDKDEPNATDTEEVQKKPEDATTGPDDATPQQLAEDEEVLDSSAREETRPEKSVEDQEDTDPVDDPRSGAEETTQKNQEIPDESVLETLAEAEAPTTEYTENLPEKSQPIEENAPEEMVEIEPNPDVEVKDSKVGDDEPIQGETTQDEKKEVHSTVERITDEGTDIIGDIHEEMMIEYKEEDYTLKESPVPNASITVKVKLLPAEQVITVASMMGQTISKLREYFAAVLKMQANEIELYFERTLLKDMVILGALGVEPNGTVQLELMSADPENTPLKPYKQLSGFEQDIVSVSIRGGNGEMRRVTVEIEKSNKKKPFLGGFRHRITGSEFHNASVQTVPKFRPWPLAMQFSRSTQTSELRNRNVQTAEDTSTQMTRIGCFVSVNTDKLIAPGKYFTAQEKEDLILEKVIILQTYLRQYLAKQYVNNLKYSRKKRREFEMQQNLQRKQEKEKRIKSEFQRRMNPRANVDFDTLYDALEKWRLEEIARINSTLTGAERKAALYMLLNQETEHLAAIGRHRLEADAENRENSIQSFLHKTSAPKVIKSSYDNLPTSIETPYTVRAKELRDIYNSIIMKYLTQDERLDILLTLKHTVQEHDCKLTQEILNLIDREADLLVRGVSNENLEGLRKRIATLFLQYIKAPLFNPEAAKFIKVPPDPAKLSGKIYYCISCCNYLQSTQFPLNVNATNPGSCQLCKKKDNEARYRTDYSSYRHMLRILRMNEEQYNDDSTVAFLLQDADMRYLVEKIWGSESIISNSNDLYDLVFVRWDKSISWSPWNCLLVTIDEADKHGTLIDIYKSYGEVFVNKVQKKHQQARSYFSCLPGTAKLLRKQNTPVIDSSPEKLTVFSTHTSYSNNKT